MGSPTLTSPGAMIDVTVMIASSGTPSELPENRRPARAAARQNARDTELLVRFRWRFGCSPSPSQ
jgi:hypothetical protein